MHTFFVVFIGKYDPLKVATEFYSFAWPMNLGLDAKPNIEGLFFKFHFSEENSLNLTN